MFPLAFKRPSLSRCPFSPVFTGRVLREAHAHLQWEMSSCLFSRKQGQQIVVGSSVVVTIVRVSGDKVRIGIEAPDDMRVLRGELQPHDELAGVTLSVAGGVD